MEFLRRKADYIIDTSHLLTREFRQEIDKIFVDNEEFKQHDDLCPILWIQIRDPGRR